MGQQPHHPHGKPHGAQTPPKAEHHEVMHRVASRHRIVVLVILVVATLAFLSTWWT